MIEKKLIQLSVLLIACVGLGLNPVHAQPKEIVITLAKQAPKIDGKLDDAAWKSAVVARDFTDIKTKKPAKNQTEVKILMTREGLYFGATLFDPDPTKLVGKARPHDSKVWLDDDFEIFLYPTRQ